MVQEIKQYFQAYRAPSWAAPIETVPQEVESQPEIQPTGWVINSSANVFIDDEGLHIYEGAIFLRDVGGDSVLNPAGFQGSWNVFLRSGLYNSNFEAGTDGQLTFAANPSNVPYWHWSIRSHSDGFLAAERKPASGLGGQRVVEFVRSAGTAVETYAYIQQDRISVAGGRQQIVKVNWRATDGSTSVAKPAHIRATLYFYDVDGTYLSGGQHQTEGQTSDRVGFAWELVGSFDIPATASYCNILIGAYWPNGALSGSNVRFGNVICTDESYDFHTLQIDRVLFDAQDYNEVLNVRGGDDFNVILRGTNTTQQLTLRQDSESWHRAALSVLAGVGQIAFGSGAASPDTILRRGDPAPGGWGGVFETNGAGIFPMLGQSSRNTSNGLSNYPPGFSMMIGDDTGSGFPVNGRGILLTFRSQTTTVYGAQLWLARGSDLSASALHYRTWDNSTSSWFAWVAA